MVRQKKDGEYIERRRQEESIESRRGQRKKKDGKGEEVATEKCLGPFEGVDNMMQSWREKPKMMEQNEVIGSEEIFVLELTSTRSRLSWCNMWIRGGSRYVMFLSAWLSTKGRVENLSMKERREREREKERKEKIDRKRLREREREGGRD